MKVFINLFIIVIVISLLYIFGPILGLESRYALDQMLNVTYSQDITEEGTYEKPLKISNYEFSIIIPKIAASAPIVQDVNTSNKIEFSKSLKKGIAHSAESSLPGESGNISLFAHTDDGIFNIGKYNKSFYLLGKMKQGNGFSVYYQGQEIKYQVIDVKTIGKTATYNTENIDVVNTLTLQTNYPFGMSFKKLIVVAKELPI